MILEIAVFNIQSAILAANAGANRIELCENAADGGTTPSYGTLKIIKEKISIPVFPIIRSRGGDFFYNDDEFAVMCKDVVLCKQLGFDGIVTGLLNIDASVDITRTKYLADLAYPMEVTFHRAFGRTKDAFKSLEDIINCGCQRILTSGQMPVAADGKDLIKQLIEIADERIIIMPGSGIRSSNIKDIDAYTGATELHSSARININSPMQFTNTAMQENMQQVSVDADEIRSMKDKLNNTN